MTSVREQLIEARELIADPDHWTQGAYARNEYGEIVAPENRNACRWCALGACERVELDWEGVSLLLEVAGKPIPTLNDKDGHAATLAAFDRAIEAAA